MPAMSARAKSRRLHKQVLLGRGEDLDPVVIEVGVKAPVDLDRA
jgi:hypothetical protein